MPWIRWMLLCGVALSLGGCVNADAVLDGPNGTRVMCDGVGWGLLGAPISYISYRHCVDFYKSAGYTREGDNHAGATVQPGGAGGGLTTAGMTTAGAPMTGGPDSTKVGSQRPK